MRTIVFVGPSEKAAEKIWRESGCGSIFSWRFAFVASGNVQDVIRSVMYHQPYAVVFLVPGPVNYMYALRNGRPRYNGVFIMNGTNPDLKGYLERGFCDNDCEQSFVKPVARPSRSLYRLW